MTGYDCVRKLKIDAVIELDAYGSFREIFWIAKFFLYVNKNSQIAHGKSKVNFDIASSEDFTGFLDSMK